MYVSCILAFFKPYNPFSCIFLKIMFYNFLPSRSFWIPNGWYGGTNMFFNHRVFICLMILTLKETVNVFPRRLLSLGVFKAYFWIEIYLIISVANTDYYGAKHLVKKGRNCMKPLKLAWFGLILSVNRLKGDHSQLIYIWIWAEPTLTVLVVLSLPVHQLQ